MCRCFYPVCSCEINKDDLKESCKKVVVKEIASLG